ncbi:MAG: DNA-directed RNA polymerase subunit P [Candidatus Aenigmarchaeota archaeon]|nr:DNA-directed RNA polymerase subunit P [Candidatus Aenigmarchaeota archaeon]
MLHRCIKCKTEVDLDPNDPIRCHYCGYRILVKSRSEFRKRVKAL